MMCTRRSGTLRLYNLYSNPLCETLSKTFATSKKRTPVGILKYTVRLLNARVSRSKAELFVSEEYVPGPLK